MKTMLDKCAVAGDITQAIDRRGAWSCAITVIGGTESTAVKLQSCETADGTFEDFKTLIPSAEASASQYKGFVVDISGAKNFIKVVGAAMATCVLGDCDADVKNVAIKAGEIPSGADIEANKEVSITENGTVEITPTEGKDGMKKVTANVNVASGGGLVTPWCYKLNTYDSDKICVFDKSATVSVRVDSNIYHNVVDMQNGLNRQGDLLVVSKLSDCYYPVELSEGDNPSAMDLYEYTEEDGMVSTEDTTVNPSKTYYGICYTSDTMTIVVEQDGDTYEMVNNFNQWTEGQLSPVQP